MLRPDDLARHGVDVVFILVSVGGKFQLEDRGAVVVVEVPVVEHGLRRRDVRLGERDLLRLLQGDVGRRLSALRIGRVIVPAVDGHDAGGKVQPLDRGLRAGAHLLQEVVVREHGARLQLQDDVLFIAVHVIHEEAGLVDLHDQVLQDLVAVLPDVVGVDLHDALAVLVAAGQGEHPARLVVLDLDLRVDAQGEGAGVPQRSALRLRASGQKDCQRDSQGRDRCKEFSSRFHVGCSFRCVWIGLCLALHP